MSDKFWVLLYRDNLVRSQSGAYPTWKISAPSDRAYSAYARFISLVNAEKAAKEIVKKYGGDVHIMESVAFATVPATVVKID